MNNPPTLTDPKFSNQYGDVLVCPTCGFQYTHAGTVDIHMADKTEYTSPSGTRNNDWLAISFECEGGHSFKLVIAQHKGYTYLKAIADEPQ